MDDELAMGVAHRVAHIEEQAESGVHIRLPRPGPDRDGFAVHELHGQVGVPVFRHPAVQEASDARVIEPGKDLPFLEEATLELGGDDSGIRRYDYRCVTAP